MYKPKTLNSLFQDWLNVFKSHSKTEPLNKLPEEVQEFLETNPGSVERLNEAVDVTIVLWTQLYYEGWLVDDILEEVKRKLIINVNRQWETMPDGTIHHVKDMSNA